MRDSAFWRQVMNTINDGLFMVDPMGCISEVNKALCEMTGYTEEELLGEPCSIFQCDICAEMRGAAIETWCHLFANKRVSGSRCHIRHKNGSMIPVLKNARLLLCGSGKSGSGPCSEDTFSVETVTDLRELVEKDDYIHRVEKLLYPSSGFENMVGASSAMQRVFRFIEQAAQSSAPVFIFGESGTGKELAALALHKLSGRRDFPFVELNCASLNEHVLESELFGHVKGAFTGAIKDREGRFEAAHNGSLFLDEIGDIPLSMQVKILRVLETGVIHRVGSNRAQSVNVRIISATNRDLPALIAKGLFREDLAFRINVIPIYLPPLRERVEDIPLLVRHCIKAMRQLGNAKVGGVSQELMQAFKTYLWPGNIRELRNMLEYGTAMCTGARMGIEHMPDHFQLRSKGPVIHPRHSSSRLEPGQVAKQISPAARDLQQDAETKGDQDGRKEEIVHALTATGGNVSKAAKLLGIHRTTLINRMLKLGIRLQKNIDAL